MISKLDFIFCDIVFGCELVSCNDKGLVVGHHNTFENGGHALSGEVKGQFDVHVLVVLCLNHIVGFVFGSFFC